MSDLPEEALITFLKADDTVNTLVGGRIFGDGLPANQTPSMPRKCIVVDPSGGGQSFGTAYQEYSDARYDVRSYGETPYEAARVQRAVSRALKQLRREVHNDLLLHWAKRAGGPLALRDPDTTWPYRFESFQVLAAEEELSS